MTFAQTPICSRPSKSPRKHRAYIFYKNRHRELTPVGQLPADWNPPQDIVRWQSSSRRAVPNNLLFEGRCWDVHHVLPIGNKLSDFDVRKRAIQESFCRLGLEKWRSRVCTPIFFPTTWQRTLRGFCRSSRKSHITPWNSSTTIVYYSA